MAASWGVTPVAARVAAGERSLTFAKDHFVPEELHVEVGGRILLSWPLPRRDAQHVELALDDPEGLLRSALLDLARNPHIPGVVTTAAADLGPQDASREQGERLLRNALLLVEDESGLAALLTAHARLAGGAPLSAAALQRLLRAAAHLAGENPGLPVWLAALLPEAPRQALLQSPWYDAVVQGYRRLDASRSPAGSSGDAITETVTAAGMVFRRIPAGSFVMGDARRLTTMPDPALPYETWPHSLAVDSFYLQQREVSNAAYARFVAEHPEWAPANRAALLTRGVVAEDYLADWEDGAPPPGRDREPVVYVSAFAAEAFAAWISEQLAGSADGAGWRARLPYEAEWEYAARGGLHGQLYPGGNQPDGHLAAPSAGPQPVGHSAANGYHLQDMLGNVWEWTADWYSPTRYLLAGPSATANEPDPRLAVGSRRVVRGGSYTSDPRIVTVHTRGSQPAHWCTPVLGFRLALEKS